MKTFVLTILIYFIENDLVRAEEQEWRLDDYTGSYPEPLLLQAEGPWGVKHYVTGIKNMVNDEYHFHTIVLLAKFNPEYNYHLRQFGYRQVSCKKYSPLDLGYPVSAYDNPAEGKA